MPLVNKQPFKPNPIPDNLSPDDEVFYHELTNEIFTSHDAFFDRFLYCNSLIWSCSKTGKSGLTYKEALDSEQQAAHKKTPKSKGKRERSTSASAAAGTGSATSDDTGGANGGAGGGGAGGDGTEGPVKKKKKKYPYDPKKYSMPVPEGFDPALLTPTGKIDGRKLKSKKNKMLADELLSTQAAAAAVTGQESANSSSSDTKPKKGGPSSAAASAKQKKLEEAKRKEEEAKKKAQTQAELAKERELEAKRKKEAAALARQLERQKKEEERKKAAAFLQNWEKKCEDLERDDLMRLPQPIPIDCDIPERLFGDAVFILESLYNLYDLYNFNTIFPDGLTYDTLEEMLTEKQEDGPLRTVIQFILRLIFDTQPTGDGYGLDDDHPETTSSSIPVPGNTTTTTTTTTTNNATTTPNNAEGIKQDKVKPNSAIKTENTQAEHDFETNNSDEEEDENVDKDVNMNDLIGAAIKAAQEVKKSLSKPLVEMEIDSTNITEVLRLHLLQSGSFPKGRTIYNGWYSSREDPGLWLCMREPDLIKKLEKVTIYELEIEDRIKILHTLIYQLLSFIKTRLYIESASEQLTELRKQYRGDAAAFARWDRENCVKRMQPPKRKSEQNSNHNPERANGNHLDHQNNVKIEHNQNSNPSSINGDVNDADYDNANHNNNDKDSHLFQQLKSCLKTNGTVSSSELPTTDSDNVAQSKKRITFKVGEGLEMEDGCLDDCENEPSHNEKSHVQNGITVNNNVNHESDQSYEEQERAYQQNLVDYEDYQRERAIRYEQLNQKLLAIRTSLRSHQSIYGIHPIGRDRAYRRYWLFQSLPGLFVENDDDCLGRCLENPTPLESRYKKLFNKENPLMHANESDLIRTKSSYVNCLTHAPDPNHPPPPPPPPPPPQQPQATPSSENDKASPPPQPQPQPESTDDHLPDENDPSKNNHHHDNDEQNDLDNPLSDRLNGELQDDQEDVHEEYNGISDEMNYCTGDENTCAIHGHERTTQARWWFYHLPESIDSLVECLNKRGFRESELHDLLSAESSILKPWIVQCPSHRLNKTILEQSGIRRSRRLKTKGGRRRARKDYD